MITVTQTKSWCTSCLNETGNHEIRVGNKNQGTVVCLCNMCKKQLIYKLQEVTHEQ